MKILLKMPFMIVWTGSGILPFMGQQSDSDSDKSNVMNKKGKKLNLGHLLHTRSEETIDLESAAVRFAFDLSLTLSLCWPIKGRNPDPVQTIINGIFNRIFNIYHQKLFQPRNMHKIQLSALIHVKNHLEINLRMSKLLKWLFLLCYVRNVLSGKY